MSEPIDPESDASHSEGATQRENNDRDSDSADLLFAQTYERLGPILDDPNASARQRDAALIELADYCLSQSDAGKIQRYFDRRLAELHAARAMSKGAALDSALRVSEQDLLVSQGRMYRGLGDVERAIPCFQAALDRHTQAGAAIGSFPDLHQLLNCYQSTGQVADALALYGRACDETALEPAQRIELWLDQSILQQREGLHDEALASAQQAASLAAQALANCDEDEARVASFHTQARNSRLRVIDCLLDQGTRDEALRYAEGHLKRAREHGSADQELDALHLFVGIHHASEEPERAIQTLVQMLAIAAARAPQRKKELLVGLATVHADLGRPEAACSYFEELFALDAGKHRLAVITGMLSCVESASQRADWRSLLILADALRRFAQQTGHRRLEVEAHARLVSGLIECGRIEEAVATAAEGRALTQRYGEADLEKRLAELADDLSTAMADVRSAYAAIERCLAEIPASSDADLVVLMQGLEDLYRAYAQNSMYLRVHGLCLQGIAACRLRLGDEAGARTAAEEALARFTESADHERAGRLREELAPLLLSHGRD